MERINRLVKDGPLGSRKNDKSTFYRKKRVRAINLLEVIHIDVCGPINHIVRGGFSYFITFTDD